MSDTMQQATTKLRALNQEATGPVKAIQGPSVEAKDTTGKIVFDAISIALDALEAGLEYFEKGEKEKNPIVHDICQALRISLPLIKAKVATYWGNSSDDGSGNASTKVALAHMQAEGERAGVAQTPAQVNAKIGHIIAANGGDPSGKLPPWNPRNPDPLTIKKPPQNFDDYGPAGLFVSFWPVAADTLDLVDRLVTKFCGAPTSANVTSEIVDTTMQGLIDFGDALSKYFQDDIINGRIAAEKK